MQQTARETGFDALDKANEAAIILHATTLLVRRWDAGGGPEGRS